MSRCVWDLIGNYTLNMHYNFCSLMLCKAVNIFFNALSLFHKTKGGQEDLIFAERLSLDVPIVYSQVSKHGQTGYRKIIITNSVYMAN